MEWNKLANPLITLDLSDNNLTGMPKAYLSDMIREWLVALSTCSVLKRTLSWLAGLWM